MANDIIKRFKELSTYNPQKGIINESFGDVDTTGWICVGEVPYWPWGNSGDKVYIMVNPQKTMKWGEEIREVRYTENNDGSGKQTESIPSYAKERITIYPEHHDDELGEMFLGKKKDENIIEQEHKEFLSKLFRKGNQIIIHHNSSFVIKDGIIKKGKTNPWSNNSDIGIYFWASRNSGSDPSGSTQYTYYSIIPLIDLYDFQTNAERLSLPQAMSKYPYVGQYWRDNESVVVTTYRHTPILCILDKQTGTWYNKDWIEINEPF